MYILIAVLVVALIVALIGCIRYRLMVEILINWMLDNDYKMPDGTSIERITEKLLNKNRKDE